MLVVTSDTTIGCPGVFVPSSFKPQGDFKSGRVIINGILKFEQFSKTFTS